MKNKTLNPFKMWGSWIGLILAFVVVPISFEYLYVITGIVLIWAWISGVRILPIDIILLFLILISGFILGYSIQLLIRKIRRKK